MPKQRGSESGKEAVKAVEWTAQSGLKRERRTRVSRKKQLQRLIPTEDERKLQTKRFVKLRVWRPKGRNHRLMIVDI